MEALQYLYTSWKNGDSPEKGYMIYSKSLGITDEECDDIKFVMQYEPPKEMIPNPTEDQILDEFPYSFAYFGLSSGRVCVAQSTYLGKDYSGRFGNYLIHALVMDRDEMQDYPVEFFGEDFIKTYMTEEELDADSPVPPLPPLEVEDLGSVINDGEIMDFVEGREDQLKYLLSAVLLARKQQIPLFLNDTRENLVMWCAAIQKMFPLPVATHFLFSTYVCNQEKFSQNMKEEDRFPMVIGVRPDANYFSYVSETNSTRHIVADFLGGSCTKDVPILKIAEDLTDSYSEGMDRIYDFGSFLDGIGYDAFDFGLEYAYQCYCIQKGEPFSYTAGELGELLHFAGERIPESMNTDIATALLESIEPWLETITPEDMEALAVYLYRYADFMSYTVHSMLLDFIYRLNEEGRPAESIFQLLKDIELQSPEMFQDLLTYFSSHEMQSEHCMYLEGNPDRNTSCFYGAFLMRYFADATGKLPESVEKLFSIIVNNILNGQDCGQSVETILAACDADAGKEQHVLAALEEKCEPEKQESVTLAVVDFLQGQDPEKMQEFFDALMEDPATIPLCCRILAVLIRKADDGEKMFWNFYRRQERRLEEEPGADLDCLIDAYLDKKDTADAAVEVLEQIPVSHIHGRDTGMEIITRIEHLAPDKLRRQPPEVLERAEALADQDGLQDGVTLIEAILFEQHCEDDRSTVRTFTELAAGYKFRLDGLDKKVYDNCLRNGMYYYVQAVQSEEDLRRLFDMLFCDQYANLFADEYVRALKQIMKDKRTRWLNCLTATNRYLIANDTGRGALKEFCGPYFKYLQKLDEEDYNMIYKMTIQQVDQREGKLFFERALGKSRRRR